MLKKLSILGLAVAIATGGVVWFVILPTLSDIKMINDALKNERIDLEKKYQRGQLLNKTIDDFERVKDQKKDLEKIFVTRGDELEFVTILEGIAEANNVAQKLSLKSEDEQKKTNKAYIAVPLTIELESTFPQLLTYLHSLDQLDFYITSKNINMNSNSVNNDIINTTIIGQFYTIEPQIEKE